MIFKIYSIHDVKAAAYLPPFTMRTDGEASRAFQGSLWKDTLFKEHPGDFSLFRMGDFDDALGVIRPEKPGPMLIATGLNLLNTDLEVPSVTRQGVPGLLKDPRTDGEDKAL